MAESVERLYSWDKSLLAYGLARCVLPLGGRSDLFNVSKGEEGK